MSNQAPPGCSFIINEAGSEKIFSPEQFSEEQRMFAQSALDFVERDIVPDIERLEQHEEGLMAQKLKKAGELGLLMIDIPEEFGGLGLDLLTSMLCTEVMSSYSSWSVTFGAHTGIGTLPLLYFGNSEQRERYLPKLATGEMLAAYALTEPGAGSDALNAKTKAVLVTGDDGKEYWKLNGTKMWITNGGFADLLTTFAKVDGQAFSAFLIESSANGFECGAEEQKMGIRGSSTTEIVLNDTLIPKENLLGEIGKGHKVAFNVLNIGRFKLGVGCAGGAKNLITESIRYANERIAFGQPIIQFGAIREKIADMAIKTYALESMCYRLGGNMVDRIHSLDRSAPDYNKQVMKAIEEYTVEDSIAKVYGSEVVDFAVDETLQIHGGYGYSADYPVEREYRDSRVNRIFEGTNEINRMLIPGVIMKRTMKGQLPLFALIQKITGELELEKPEPPALDAPDFAWECFFAETAKKVALFSSNAAVQRFMTNLKDEQEILIALADQMTEVYAMDSTIARLKQYPGECQAAIARALIADGYAKVLNIARKLAPSFAATPKGLAKHQKALSRWTFNSNADIVATKRKVADIIIDRETWPFG